MRLSFIVVALASSFLASSEALSATADSNQAQIAKVSYVRGPSQRLLRVPDKLVGMDADDSLDSEERGLTPGQIEKLKRLAGELGIDLEKAQKSAMYLQNHPNYSTYSAKLSKYIKRNKQHGPPRITYE